MTRRVRPGAMSRVTLPKFFYSTRLPRCAGPLILTLLIGLGPAAAQPGNTGAVVERADLPEGVAGDRVREVIELINAGNAARIIAFSESHFVEIAQETSPAEHAAAFLNFRGRTGGVDFRCDREFENEGLPHQTLAIVRARSTGLYFHIDMGVRPDGKVSHLFFGPTRPPAAEVPPRPSEAELPAALKGHVERLAASGAFSGAVLLARDGQVLYEGAFGVANRDYNVPVTIDTKFNLASTNKMFTAVAIGQLVERGTLSWDDRAAKFLSRDWLSAAAAEKVRIEHLLTHTAGMGDYLASAAFQDSSRLRFRELGDYRPLVRDRAPSFEPGSKWSYSNTGYLLLGAVIEAASGKSYFDYVRENISLPAGMTDTDCYELDKPVTNLAIGYSVEYGPPDAPPVYRNNTFRHVLRGSSAGGGYSTVRDLLRFDTALRGGKLIRQETFQRLITPRSDLNEPEDYALGFVVQRVNGGRIVGHGGGGGDMGINAEFLMYLDSGYTFACLSNSSDGASILASQVMEWLPGTR